MFLEDFYDNYKLAEGDIEQNSLAKCLVFWEMVLKNLYK